MKNIFDKYLQISDLWKSELGKYSDEQFIKKPTPDSWSIGQVYEHLVFGALNYHIKQIEQCPLDNANQKEKKTFLGRLVYFINSFPPVRIKVSPFPTYTPKQPETKEKLKIEMRFLQKKLQGLSRTYLKNDLKSH